MSMVLSICSTVEVFEGIFLTMMGELLDVCAKVNVPARRRRREVAKRCM
jgi:hypothetical protein